MLIWSVLLFALGLVLLIKGGDWFVDGAVGIANRFRLPAIVVGATVVSIGTTLPEVMTSVTGAVQGSAATAYGNAIGSIICNTALIAAISVAVNPGPVNVKNLKMPVLFFFGAAAVYCTVAYTLQRFDWWLGLILLAAFVVYMFLTVRNGIKNPVEVSDEDELEELPSKPKKLWQELVLLVVGAALIAVGAMLLVEHGPVIARAMGVPETVVTLLFVALGTSLPELVTTITSLKKGNAALGIGNVIGANVFNLVLVSGAAMTISPFDLPMLHPLAGLNVDMSLVIDIPVMLGVMLLLCVPALITKKLARWQGIALLGVYVAFTVLQFVL